MNAKVSVIIPVYNAEQYLRKCLDSVLAQTYQDFEIICIDDGSMDNSGAICDEYAKKDSRVRVLHKENGGVSSARNAGLNIAEGGYITFVDNDDYLDADYIQMLYENIADADSIACGGRDVLGDKEVRVCIPEDKIFFTNQQIKNAYRSKKDLYLYFRTPFEKLYRSNVIGNLRFDESLKTSGEDIIFNIEFLRKASKVRTLHYCGYNYYSNKNSITRSRAAQFRGAKEEEYIQFCRIRDNALRNWGFDEEYFAGEEKRRKVLRYFTQIQNMMLPGTPYNKKQIREKIKAIHADPVFAQAVRMYTYKDLPLRGKIAKLSAQLNMPRFTIFLFQCITHAQIVIGKSAGLSRWVNKCKKRKK